MIRRAFLLLLLAAFAAAGAAHAQQQPGGASGRGQQRLVTTERSVVVTANPIASRVGFDVLRAGGSAVDAAIAIQLALTLVEPQSSGLGGGLVIEQAAGPAARAGVQRGDVLIAVNDTPVRNIDQVREAIGKNGKTVALLIQRGANRIFVPVELG